MNNVDAIVQEHYAILFDNRFNNYAEEEKKQCDCGRYIDLDENICEVCKNELKKRFSILLHDNFTEEEIEMLNDLYDGEEIR